MKLLNVHIQDDRGLTNPVATATDFRSRKLKLRDFDIPNVGYSSVSKGFAFADLHWTLICFIALFVFIRFFGTWLLRYFGFEFQYATLFSIVIAMFLGYPIFTHMWHRSYKIRIKSRVLSRNMCPSCLYGLTDITAESDGCTVCPECGAAWKLPITPNT